MAQSKGARSKGGSLAAGSGTGTVHVVLSASTAKDLLNALAQAVGSGGKQVAGKAAHKAASRARSKAVSRPGSKAAPKAAPKAASRPGSKASPKA